MIPAQEALNITKKNDSVGKEVARILTLINEEILLSAGRGYTGATFDYNKHIEKYGGSKLTADVAHKVVAELEGLGYVVIPTADYNVFSIIWEKTKT